jgi:hypothetical protein
MHQGFWLRANPGLESREIAMTKRTSTWAAVIVGALSVFSSGPTRGDERYYAMIFGSQSSPKRLRYTHTWATFIRVVGEGDDPSGYQVYQHRISWLPASLDVRTWALLPERGVNLDLYATLEAVYRNGESVTRWGPFEMLPQVYARSLKVKEILDSGAAQ